MKALLILLLSILSIQQSNASVEYSYKDYPIERSTKKKKNKSRKIKKIKNRKKIKNHKKNKKISASGWLYIITHGLICYSSIFLILSMSPIGIPLWFFMFNLISYLLSLITGLIASIIGMRTEKDKIVRWLSLIFAIFMCISVLLFIGAIVFFGAQIPFLFIVSAGLGLLIIFILNAVLSFLVSHKAK